MTATGESATAESPWYKRWWIWAIAAAAVIAIIVAVVVGVNAGGGSGGSAGSPTAGQTPDADGADATDGGSESDGTGPDGTGPDGTGPDGTETNGSGTDGTDEGAAEEQPAEPADPGRSSSLDEALRQALGVAEYSELRERDSSLWGGYVVEVRVVGSEGFIRLRVPSDDQTRDDFGGRAAAEVATLLPASAVEGIEWLVVEDASGGEIDRQQPQPSA